jgi:transcriptional regulator with XRE-family HTH domain
MANVPGTECYFWKKAPQARHSLFRAPHTPLISGTVGVRRMDDEGNVSERRAAATGAPEAERVIGERIRLLRRQAGLSVEQLAARVGSSTGTISRLERGQVQGPKHSLLTRLARAFGHPSVDAMLREAGGESDHRAGADAKRDTERPAERISGPAVTGVNVTGLLEALRAREAHPLAVYRWGTCGDPRDHESPPDPDRLEYPPLGRHLLIGPRGFGVEVRGESMGRRGIHDGDVVWVNPERPYRMGGVVLALVEDGDGESGMVVKTILRDEAGERLFSDGEDGRRPFPCRSFHVVGPVVWVSPRGHPPA